jgi:hypothetical protein
MIIKGFKFLTKGMKSSKGNVKWKLNTWKHEDEIELCVKGFHACMTPLQSLNYVYGDKWFIVEAKGKIIKEDDKFVATDMRIVKKIPVKKVCVEFSIACAKRVLKNFEKNYPNDDRPRLAIIAAENWLKNPNNKNKELAESAWSAAKSSAWSAESAEKKWQNNKLTKIIKKITQ